MDTVFLVIDDQIGKHDGMIGVHTQITDPPLCAYSSVTINDEALCCGVIRCCGHEALNIRPVP
jgi:hypothetical protein